MGVVMIDSFSGDFRFLSNFVGSVTTPKGTFCATVEHAFQAAKTLDPGEQKSVLSCSTPGQAKRAGRKVTLRRNWDQVKNNVMMALVRAKFTQDSVLAAQLLATGTEPLVEGNRWHDNYWGSCTCSRCGDAGKNRLGQILMQVRSELPR